MEDKGAREKKSETKSNRMQLKRVYIIKRE